MSKPSKRRKPHQHAKPRGAIDFSESPALTAEFWQRARVFYPPRKAAVWRRIDRDVLGWFRQRGGRYQSLMNAVLRSYMETARTVKGSGYTPRRSPAHQVPRRTPLRSTSRA